MTQKKRTRRTKEQIQADKSKGLGDTIDKITTATGIKALVKFISGEDCGCEERKEKLNKLFPYKQLQVNCLDELEYNFLQGYFIETEKNPEVKPSTQQKVYEIYNRIFSDNKKIINCSQCYRDVHKEIKMVFDEYVIDEKDGQA